MTTNPEVALTMAPRRNLLDRTASWARRVVERGLGVKLGVHRQYPPKVLRVPRGSAQAARGASL
ncbi:MAG: hypothetical protein JO112_12915, partial [Planctomycetes bacterium]|nr:hypothetical protein [Planctomycetota bacterium]